MIQVFRPDMGDEEIDAVAEVIRSGWIGLGPRTEEFEERFANRIGTEHAVGLNSATAALKLALKLLDVGPGDEVIVPTMTFVSTAHVARYHGATPVFADVEWETMNISLEDVERKLGPDTAAVVPVHYGGRPVDMEALSDVTDDVPIIEDCAHAAGSTYRGEPVGGIGDIGCFSFHAVKNLAMGDGGALVLDDDEMASRAERLRWLGIGESTWGRTEPGKSYRQQYRVPEIGYKCHMNDIAASLGLVQLSKLDEMNARRREIVDAYFDGLADVEQLELPPRDDEHSRSSWHIFHVKAENRDELVAHLDENDIATGIHYTPIHTYECYGEQPSLPVAEELSRYIVTLPLHPRLSDEDVERVIGEIRRFYGSPTSSQHLTREDHHAGR